MRSTFITGTTAGIRSRRRGSTLVLVLGTLALISILTIVYVSIGRADRRTATAAGERTERTGSVENLLDWPGRVIASDRLSTHIDSVEIDPTGTPVGARFAREAVDLPSTSPGFMSVVPTNQGGSIRLLELERFRFRPEGTVNQSWVAPAGSLGNYLSDLESVNGSRNADLDFRSISDPFLASTLPADIDANAVTNADPGAAYIYLRDWSHISNFAPDGRFVNLYNIRADANYSGSLWGGQLGGQQGGIDAPSGFSVGNRFSLSSEPANDPLDNRLAISDGLTLWEPRDDVDDPWIATSLYRSPGDPNGTGADLTGNALPLINLPATWDTNQRELFRPAVDLPGDPGWDDPTYWQYQYADADGDGFLDSRWQELVDASDLRNQFNLSGSSGVRLFFAARAIDLSSMVNVNTAADAFASPGEVGERLGASPAEIDLRRVLTLEDVWADYSTDDIAQLGYGSFVRPNDFFLGGERGDAGDYSEFWPFQISGSGSGGVFPMMQYYSARGSVAAIRRTLEDAVPPPSGLNARNQYEVVEDLRDPSVGLFSNVYSPYLPANTDVDGDGGFEPILGLTNRAGDYSELGGTYGSSRAPSLFGTDDLGELLAFWGANNDRVTSRLELAVAGRGSHSGFTGNRNDAFHLSPLRSDRSSVLELTRGDWNNNNRYDTGGFGEAERDLLFSVFNSRRYLTTFSGASPISGEKVLGSGNEIGGTSALRLQADETRRLLHAGAQRIIDPMATPALTVDQLTTNAFDFYLDVLAPYATEMGAYTDPTKATEAYGHRGPALPVRIAAHLAANARDMADDDSDPTTVALGPLAVAADPNAVSLVANAPGSAGTDFDDVLIYGIEAQPFIVEAAMFNVFADAPVVAGGDFDWRDQSPFDGVVTVDSLIDSTNPDFLFQLFAVQISNPFEVALTLEGYYVEFGDQLFEVPTTPLPAGATIMAYATTPQKQDVLEARVDSVVSDGSPTTNFSFDAFLNRQLSGATQAGVAGRIEMSRLSVDGSTPAFVSGGSAENTLPAQNLDDVDEAYDMLAETGATGHANRVVYLWRQDAGLTPNRLDDLLVDRLQQDPDDFPILDTRPTFDPNITDQGGTTFVPRTVAGPSLSGGNTTNGMVRGLWQTSVSSNQEALMVDDGSRHIFGFVFAASLARPSDPANGNGPVGALPAWAIESKPVANTAFGGLNQLLPGSLDPALIGQETSLADAQMNEGIVELFTDSTELIDNEQVESMRDLPDNKNTDDINRRRSLTMGAAGPGGPGGPGAGTNYDERLTELALLEASNAEFANQRMRVGDTLLPLAAGPMYKPGASGISDRSEELTDEWTTLSESLALVLGYAAEVSPGMNGQPDVYDEVGGLRATGLVYSPATAVLDLGRVRLDDYVLFTDGDTSGTYDPVLAGIDPATGRYADQLRGPGIPAALRTFAIATAGGELAQEQYGTIDRPMTGTVNINTAPLAVLRTLPTLSPPMLAETGIQTWWARRAGATNWPSAENQLNADVAASIRAYRDRSSHHSRPTEFGGPQGLEVLTQRLVDFQIADGDESLFRVSEELNVRSAQSGIDGVREGAGLMSLGELFGVRLTNNGNAGVWRSMDGLGRDGENLSLNSGVEAAYYGGQNDGIADDYEEQLVALNAIANSASVRSDFFAVWMIIQGFRDQDVTGLAPSQPLSPSFRDRYLMIYDRSNVTEPGDEPRLLYRRKIRQ